MEAWQFVNATPKLGNDLPVWLYAAIASGRVRYSPPGHAPAMFFIKVPESMLRAYLTDWIVRDETGRIFVRRDADYSRS